LKSASEAIRLTLATLLSRWRPTTEKTKTTERVMTTKGSLCSTSDRDKVTKQGYTRRPGVSSAVYNRIMVLELPPGAHVKMRFLEKWWATDHGRLRALNLAGLLARPFV
jgi:hypothetical protein